MNMKHLSIVLLATSFSLRAVAEAIREGSGPDVVILQDEPKFTADMLISTCTIPAYGYCEEMIYFERERKEAFREIVLRFHRKRLIICRPSVSVMRQRSVNYDRRYG
jgi:hypothetical protein